MMLVLTKRTEQTLSIEILDDEGLPQYQSLLNRFKDRDIRWLSKLWGESVPHVTAKLNEVCETITDDYTPEAIEFTPDDSVLQSILTGSTVEKEEVLNTDPLYIRVRGIEQLQSHGVSFSNAEPCKAFREAVEATWNHSPNPELEFVIEWNDTSKFVCLDIDYHTLDLEHRPDISHFEAIVSRIKPQPYCWHPTHGKGCKLYYACNPGYTAKELASIAGIAWIGYDPTATFDLIKSTRHPCYNRKRDGSTAPIENLSDIHYVHGNGDLSSVKRMLTSEIEWADIENYLAERNLSIGQTLPHTECPIDPTEDKKPNVYVGDKGFFCHRCYARGLGSTPGFVGYSSIIGCIDNRLSLMVKNFCHLEHAKIVLSNIYPNVPIKILEDVYRVMMKVVHNIDDPRINIAMRSGTGFIRIRGQWVSTNGDSSLAHGLPAFVASLPATKIVKKGGENAGELIPDISKVTAFLNDGDLENYGYQEVSFLRGCKIFGHYNNYPHGEIIKVVTRKEFNSCQPRWVPPNQRMDTEEAWHLLEEEFPGIQRNYVKLLIATKGASEGRLAQCPFLLVSGVSGAGKSTTVHIAAGICGDKADEPIWTPNTERFRQGLMDGIKQSGFICVNEVFKYADKANVSYTQALDPMLSLTEDSRSHVLYVGSVPFGRLPVFVLTDINIPPEVVADRQIARRFTFYRLDSESQWTDTLVRRQIRPHQFRLISSTHATAADSILSDIIDTYFQVPRSLNEIAEELSIQTLATYEEDVSRSKDVYREFFVEVCKLPEPVGSYAKRYNPKVGWKCFDRMCETPVLSLWNELCDGQEPDKWSRSRQIDQIDWSKLLGLKFPTVCEYRLYKGTMLFIRFRSTDNPKTPGWMNGKHV